MRRGQLVPWSRNNLFWISNGHCIDKKKTLLDNVFLSCALVILCISVNLAEEEAKDEVNEIPVFSKDVEVVNLWYGEMLRIKNAKSRITLAILFWFTHSTKKTAAFSSRQQADKQLDSVERCLIMIALHHVYMCVTVYRVLPFLFVYIPISVSYKVLLELVHMHATLLPSLFPYKSVLVHTHTNTHVYFWTHVFCGLKNVLFLLSCFFFGMLTHKDRNKYKRTRYSDCLQCQDLVTDDFSYLSLCSGFPPTVPNMAKAWFILFSNDVLLKVNKSRYYNCEMLLLPK